MISNNLDASVAREQMLDRQLLLDAEPDAIFTYNGSSIVTTYLPEDYSGYGFKTLESAELCSALQQNNLASDFAYSYSNIVESGVVSDGINNINLTNINSAQRCDTSVTQYSVSSAHTLYTPIYNANNSNYIHVFNLSTWGYQGNQAIKYYDGASTEMLSYGLYNIYVEVPILSSRTFYPKASTMLGLSNGDLRFVRSPYGQLGDDYSYWVVTSYKQFDASAYVQTFSWSGGTYKGFYYPFKASGSANSAYWYVFDDGYTLSYLGQTYTTSNSWYTGDSTGIGFLRSSKTNINTLYPNRTITVGTNNLLSTDGGVISYTSLYYTGETEWLYLGLNYIPSEVLSYSVATVQFSSIYCCEWDAFKYRLSSNSPTLGAYYPGLHGLIQGTSSNMIVYCTIPGAWGLTTYPSKYVCLDPRKVLFQYIPTSEI